MNTTTPTRLLVVDDDKEIVRLLRAYLEQAGFLVFTAYDGETAFHLIRRERPSLVLLDLMLPDRDGWDITKKIRADTLLSNTPIIMITARVEDSDKIVGLELGADDYVTKPFGLSELRSRIRALLRRSYGELAGAENSDTLYAGDLTIDRGRGQVSRAGQSLHLTPTEFRLLITLVQHNGQVLSRAQLLDAVWGWTPDIESEKTVNVHIRRLREKVEPDPANPILILTVPGLGYRFAD